MPAEDSARRAIITILASAVSALEAALILADGREIVELGRLLDAVKRQKELAEERAGLVPFRHQDSRRSCNAL